EHHRVGRGGGIEQQGGQALGFPDQGVVLLGVVDEQGVQGVGTVGLDHWVFSSNKVLGGVATGVGHSVAGQEAVFVEVVDDGLNLLLQGHVGGLEVNLGVGRRIVGVVDAGEILDLAGPGFFVQPLGVALLGLLDGAVDVDLDKGHAGFLVQLAHVVAVGPVGADKAGQ